ncbi:MAG: hypothetical protein RIE59_10905 [Imperialibacter sp.]
MRKGGVKGSEDQKPARLLAGRETEAGVGKAGRLRWSRQTPGLCSAG